MGVVSSDLLKNQITSITFCFGGPQNDAIKYRFLVYSSSTTYNSHENVDLTFGKKQFGGSWRTIRGLWNNSIKFRFIMHSYNIHRCIYIKLYPGHFLKCQLQVDLFCFNCLGCRYYTYIDHSSKIHTVYLTYASFFQMEDSQIPSTTFIGFSAPDDIVPHGSTNVTLQCH